MAWVVSIHPRGWVSAGLIEPRALHVMLSPAHREFAENYLRDLAASLAETAPHAAKTASYAG